MLQTSQDEGSIHKGAKQRPLAPEAQFGLLLTAKKEALQQRCRTYDAVGWFLPSLRAKLLALQLKFVHGEHQRAPQDRHASAAGSLGLRPAV